jgi:hypothetical protein
LEKTRQSERGFFNNDKVKSFPTPRLFTKTTILDLKWKKKFLEKTE